MRTKYCGNVTKEHLGKDVSICGWVHEGETMVGYFS
ncbi:MAG: hypothetical protein Ct9H90mP6_09840 [Gammaproteobacteria bacterium]|nr:MAG: hypothetical protein Ct9H90mP6_09840 [Gammaproteobacteria bacterium]